MAMNTNRMNITRKCAVLISLLMAASGFISCGSMLDDITDHIVSFEKMVAAVIKGRPDSTLNLRYDGRDIAPDGTIDMGNTLQDSEKSITISISNMDDEMLTLSQIDIIVNGDEDDNPFSVSGITLPVDIAPGSEISFTVTFQEDETPGARTARVKLFTREKSGKKFDPFIVTVTCERTETPRGKLQVWYGSTLLNGRDTFSIGSNPYCILQCINIGTGDIDISGIALDFNAVFHLPLPGPSTISPGGSDTLTVTFEPTGLGSFRDAVTVNYSDGVDTPAFSIQIEGAVDDMLHPQIELRDGAEICADPHTHAFSDQLIWTQSTGKTFQINNVGEGVLNISGIALTDAAEPDNFTYDGPASAKILPGESTTFSVSYFPQTTGSHTATVSITSDDPDAGESTLDLVLNGTALAPLIEIRKDTSTIPSGNTAPDFGSISADGDGSIATAYEEFTIVNTGTANLLITGVNIAGSHYQDFDLDTTGMATELIPDASTTFIVRFDPLEAGSRSAVLQISSNVYTPPVYTVDLTGTGLIPQTIVVSEGSIPIPSGGSATAYTGVGVDGDGGLASAYRPFTIQNAGELDLVLSGVSITGTGADSFDLYTADMVMTLTPGQSTTFSVRFDPLTEDAVFPVVEIASNAFNQPAYTMNLTGNGVTPPTIVVYDGSNPVSNNGSAATFGSIGADGDGRHTGAARVFTIKNTGALTLDLSSVSLTGTGANNFNLVTTGMATSLTTNQSTTFTIYFDPLTTGAKTASVQVASNATNYPNFAFNLSGTGITPKVQTTVKVARFFCPIVGGGGSIEVYWDVTIQTTIGAISGYWYIAHLSRDCRIPFTKDYYLDYPYNRAYGCGLQATDPTPTMGSTTIVFNKTSGTGFQLNILTMDRDTDGVSSDDCLGCDSNGYSVGNSAKVPVTYNSTNNVLYCDDNNGEDYVINNEQVYSPWSIPIDGITRTYRFYTYRGGEGVIIVNFEISATDVDIP
jgi:hypothetical protein